MKFPSEAKFIEIRRWMKAHKDFVRAMMQYDFEIAKGSWGEDVNFDAEFVEKMLQDNELEVNFSAEELLDEYCRYEKITDWL